MKWENLVQRNKNSIWIILAIWVGINVLQSICTELFRDEAYFWMWSQFPAWGYFDNGPFISWQIWLTESWIPGELGVRLGAVLLNGGVMYLMYQMTDKQNPLLFFALCFSMFEVHIGGFFAAPDSPLIFFATLFLFLLRDYLENDSWKLAIGMGVVAACIFYSKYQGLMFLFFLLLPNLKLLTRRSFWLMGLVSLLLLIPWINQLIEQNFGTLVYHLQDRAKGQFNWNYITNYLGGQLGVAGPLMSLILFPATFLIKPQSAFERTLKFAMWGILGFLLFMSTRVWVEANWAATAMMPMILLTYTFLQQKLPWKKWVYRLAVPSILLMLVFRVYLVVDIFPAISKQRNEVHGWEAFLDNIAEKAGDHYAIFVNNYGRPAKYEYYTGKKGHSINNYHYHKNNYDLWGIDEKLWGETVYFVNSRPFVGSTDSLFLPSGRAYFGGKIENFHSYSKIDLVSETTPQQLKRGDTLWLPITFVNNYDFPVTFEENPSMKAELTAQFNYKGMWGIHAIRIPDIYWKETLTDSYEKTVPIVIPEEFPAGKYLMITSIWAGWLPASINGKLIRVEILP